MFWTGTKKVAFISTFRPNAAPPDVIPPDWESTILRRVHYDLSPSGRDVSLRAWVTAASSGVADIEGAVMPRRSIDRQDVPPGVFEAELGPRLREQGFDHAAIVMLGGPGAGTNAGFWSRFVMVESNGVWAMEIIHGLTGFRDLYHLGGFSDPADRALGRFDEMAAASLTHPTAYTKRLLGWVPDASVPLHSGRHREYELHHASLHQPPVAGGVTAVRIGQGFPHAMVESRAQTDQFEQGISGAMTGIPSEGVIAYRIQTTSDVALAENAKLPVYLLTKTALVAGDVATLDDGVELSVLGATPTGFRIAIDDPRGAVVNWSTLTSAPKALRDPFSLHRRRAGLEYLAYVAEGSAPVVLWRSERDRGVDRLAEMVVLPPSTSSATIYEDTAGGTAAVLFSSGDDHAHTVYRAAGVTGHDDLSALTGSPGGAALAPVGWQTPAGAHHVAIRSADGHLRVIWWTGADPAAVDDLTTATGAPLVAGTPSAYFDATRGTNVVAFRSVDRHIRSIYWNAGPAGHDDLSGVADSPLAGGDPVAWWTAEDDSQRFVYPTADGRVVEIHSAAGNAAVTWRDLSAPTGAPAAQPAHQLGAGFDPEHGEHHVVYADIFGSLHDLSWPAGIQDAPAHLDLTAAFGAPPAAGGATFWSTSGEASRHVAYRTADGEIYEIWW